MRASAEVVVVTTRDDFLLELGAVFANDASVYPAESFDTALERISAYAKTFHKLGQGLYDIDEYVATMRDQNNGGYANSWLIGDRKTGEIAYLELGLQHTPLTRKKDGYFVSANFAVDPDPRGVP